ncbi:dUTP diphosphatase [Deferribacter autotrophicus]|uniref:Deoxyuridine 5'-triphosphate nucleotidohydrolase n=1 Tax=Deferribacter autotrophicus TaxID=500465 RepID=A0A5A8F1U0_9BACT|nr:dUTP diphosphatase [Deferribacter autotrophicus]KAA0258070.1 dUTP diphosphatase [Deferribacter autotrophicus]
MKKLKIKLKCLEKDLVPEYKSSGSSGMDLRSRVDVVIPSGKFKLIPTGVYVELPDGYEAQVRPRSGLALKHGITVLNTPGTIDSDYRGEIKVILVNFGNDDFQVKRGDRIAQLVVAEVIRAEVEIVDEITETERGDGGFGSTGVD